MNLASGTGRRRESRVDSKARVSDCMNPASAAGGGNPKASYERRTENICIVGDLMHLSQKGKGVEVGFAKGCLVRLVGV